LRTAFLLTGDRGHAEDLVQLALERTARRWSGLNGSPEAFARKVLLHAATDRWRRRQARVQEVFDDAVDEPAIADGVDQLLLRRDLVAALQRLPSQQRAALVLRYFLDLSEMETARELDISVGTVKSTVSRALERLRALVPVDLNQEAHR
jgi:RNA polymerase sigma-70 factor (sigma-E family)